MKEVTPTANMKLFSLIVSASISSHTDESTQHWGGPIVFFPFPASSGKSIWGSNKCIDAWKNKTWCSGFHGEVHLVYFDGNHRTEAALTVKWGSECLQNSILIYFDCCITTLEVLDVSRHFPQYLSYNVTQSFQTVAKSYFCMDK